MNHRLYWLKFSDPKPQYCILVSLHYWISCLIESVSTILISYICCVLEVHQWKRIALYTQLKDNASIINIKLQIWTGYKYAKWFTIMALFSISKTSSDLHQKSISVALSILFVPILYNCILWYFSLFWCRSFIYLSWMCSYPTVFH